MASRGLKFSKVRAWKMVRYEVLMYFGTNYVRTHLQGGNSPNVGVVRNALVESSLLHMRILTEIFLSRGTQPDDVNLQKLGFAVPIQDQTLAQNIGALETAYGSSRISGSRCWTINKMLAHPTTHRSSKYNYSPLFNAMEGPLTAVITRVYKLTRRKLPYRTPAHEGQVAQHSV